MDANGSHIFHEYDGAERLTRVAIGSNSYLELDYDVTPVPGCGEWALGRVTGERSYDDGRRIVTESLCYDLAGQGRPTSLTTDIAGGPSFVAGFGYDSLGYLDELRYPRLLSEPERRVVELTVERGFVRKVAESGGGRTFVEEVKTNPAGGLKQWRYGNGVLGDMPADALNRPASPAGQPPLQPGQRRPAAASDLRLRRRRQPDPLALESPIPRWRPRRTRTDRRQPVEPAHFRTHHR